MTLHALSRGCKHADGVYSFSVDSGDAGEFIVGIQKPNRVSVDRTQVHL